MKKVTPAEVVSLIFMFALSGGLLVFTAGKTVRVIQATLPADDHLSGYLALIALDGGLILWPLIFKYAAKNAYQKAISGIMIALSFVGVMAAAFTDTAMQSSKNGYGQAVSVDQFGGVVWIVTGVILLNVGAGVMMHLLNGQTVERTPEPVRQYAPPEPEPALVSEIRSPFAVRPIEPVTLRAVNRTNELTTGGLCMLPGCTNSLRLADGTLPRNGKKFCTDAHRAKYARLVSAGGQVEAITERSQNENTEA